MYYVYILKSEKDGSRYVGTTTDLKNRIEEHNKGETKSNKSKIPYKISWCCAFSNKTLAYNFERYLKSSSGHAFTNKHLVTRDR
ncbi:MAG: GIY-YIG nuclease family protein [Patescibacteria group bacterium]